jgi:hypothetical protein
MLKTQVKENRLIVSIGDWQAVSLDVNDRFRVNGSKNMRNTAIHITVHDFWYGRTLGNSVTVKKACDVIKQMGFDPVEIGFIQLCREHQWGGEIPVEYLDQPQLFQ